MTVTDPLPAPDDVPAGTAGGVTDNADVTAGDASGGTAANRVSLPYVDNAKAILLTVAINLAVVFVFFWPDGVVFGDVIADTITCVIVTVIFDMTVVHAKLKKLRSEGKMPSRVPVSRIMQKLPKSPYALCIVYIIIFAPLAVGANAAVLLLYGMEEMDFVPWMMYKLLFSTLLSVIVAEYCIFRYVQPDWANAHGVSNNEDQSFKRPVKDPLPKVSVLRELYGSVTGYIALNIIRGCIMGTVILNSDNTILIEPTSVNSVFLTGITFGFMIGFLVTNGVLTKMNKMIREQGAAILRTAVGDKWFSRMPVRRLPLILSAAVCMSIFSSVALGTLMTVFGVPEMHFFQFIVFITVYAIVMGRPLSYILTRRCMQPDYIRYVMEHKESGLTETLLERYS